MTERFTAGLVQMRSGRTPEANIAVAESLIREAAAGGAAYILTPEMTNILDRNAQATMAAAQLEAEDPALARFRHLAEELRVWLHIGSLAVRGEAGVVDRGYLVDPDGAIAARYDKIHMFDVDLPGGESWRESRLYHPGNEAVVADLPWTRVGLTICYDLRFPQLFRALAHAGSTVIAVPAAFTRQTGQAHWHVLLRARAIETGSFVLAAAQGGRHEDGRETFGHSLAVDPWGRVLAEAEDEPGVLLVEIDPGQSLAVRQQIPALKHDREFAHPAAIEVARAS